MLKGIFSELTNQISLRNVRHFIDIMSTLSLLYNKLFNLCQFLKKLLQFFSLTFLYTATVILAVMYPDS